MKLDVLALAVTVKRLNCRCRLAKAALPISRDVFLLVLVAGNHGSAEFDGLSPITRSSVATRMHGGTCLPDPCSAAGSWELPKSEEKKIGGGVRVPDHLGLTDCAEMCSPVTKYISRLDTIPTTNYTPRI